MAFFRILGALEKLMNILYWLTIIVCAGCVWTIINWFNCRFLFENMPTRRIFYFIAISHVISLLFFGLLISLMFFVDQYYLGNMIDNDVYIDVVPCILIGGFVLGIYICHRNSPDANAVNH